MMDTSTAPLADETSTELERIDFLKQVIVFTEFNVRSYDIKAQISLAAFVLSANPLIAIISATCGQNTHMVLVVALIVFVLTITMYLWVLWPTSAPDKRLTAGLGSGDLFYLSDPLQTAADYSARLRQLRAEPELTAEVLKLSYIRKVKSRRFKTAVATTLMAYTAITVEFFAIGRCAF